MSYTAARTFAAAPYSYGPLLVGVVLLALGVGGIVGSVLGGKLSDLRLRRKAIELGHKAPAEERIKSSFLAMILCPLAFIMYAWTVQQDVMIAAPVVSLVLLGFSTFWPYSTSLSYIVSVLDAESGHLFVKLAHCSGRLCHSERSTLMSVEHQGPCLAIASLEALQLS